MDELTSELVILWVLTGFAGLIMVCRLMMRWSRMHRLELGDYFTITAVIVVLLRGATITVPMIWGTNQNSDSEIAKFNSQDSYRHETGAKLTMVNRVFYTVYIWLQKCVVMCIVQQLLRGLGFTWILNLYWTTMALTFVACITVCFVECHPFSLYWQVSPNPGTCASGDLQLLVFSILEILTDVMLMVLPLRHLAKLQRPWLARLRLLVVFMVGTTIIAVTLTRPMMNRLHYHRSGASHNIANVEIFFASFVANAPPIYGLLNMKYGSSASRSRSNNVHVSNATGGQQLNTFDSSTAGVKRQKGQFGEWTTVSAIRKARETDSDEELIMQPSSDRGNSPVSSTVRRHGS